VWEWYGGRRVCTNHTNLRPLKMVWAARFWLDQFWPVFVMLQSSLKQSCTTSNVISATITLPRRALCSQILWQQTPQTRFGTVVAGPCVIDGSDHAMCRSLVQQSGKTATFHTLTLLLHILETMIVSFPDPFWSMGMRLENCTSYTAESSVTTTDAKLWAWLEYSTGTWNCYKAGSTRGT